MYLFVHNETRDLIDSIKFYFIRLNEFLSGVSNDNYLVRYNCVSSTRNIGYRDRGISRFPLLPGKTNSKREKRGRWPVSLPDSVNAKRKDPRYLSGRFSLFCRSASGYSPHVVLGQEVRLRSGRNLSRGAPLSSSLSQSSSPLASISFHPGSGWRAKGFRPADEANEFGSARCTLFGAKGSVGGK